MTDGRASVKAALKILEDAEVPVKDPGDEAARRHRLVGAIDAQLREVSGDAHGSSPRGRFAWVASAAALLLLVGAVGVMFRTGAFDAGSMPRVAELRADGSVSVVRNGHELVFGSGDRVALALDDELSTTGGVDAEATLGSGAVVDVRALTTVRFHTAKTGSVSSEELGLDRGAVALRVPKLGPHRTLSVRTPDATVRVRGTQFRVEVREEGGHTTTSVGVTEGSVWVTRQGKEIVLPKGGEWSSDSMEAEAPVAPALVAPPAALVPAPAVALPDAGSAYSASRSLGVSASSARATDPERAHDEVRSTLGVENDHYHRAVSAARAGDDRKAVLAFDDFLTRYPSSPLAQNAVVERFRALRRLGRVDEASRRARQYLAAYPSGFARAEAQSLAVQSLAPSGGQ
jgi:hypothetical protein